MILIIGGMAQGKAAYARAHYPDADRHMIRLNETAKEWHADGEDPLERLEALLGQDPDCILISEEIGNGIVPLQPEARAFREWMGRFQVEIAKRADTVIRVVCGLGQVLK